MIDINKLKGAIVSKGFSQKSFAEHVGLKPVTFNAQINRGVLDSEVMYLLKEKLKLTDKEATEIFFAKKDNQQ